MKMNVLLLGAALLGMAGQEAPTQLASAPTPAPAAASAISYQDALSCAASYQLHAGEAEMQGLKDAKKARFKASDQAAERAQKLGEASGKSPSAVEDELAARLDKALAAPPGRWP
jgi:hypothetical protein